MARPFQAWLIASDTPDFFFSRNKVLVLNILSLQWGKNRYLQLMSFNISLLFCVLSLYPSKTHDWCGIWLYHWIISQEFLNLYPWGWKQSYLVAEAITYKTHMLCAAIFPMKWRKNCEREWTWHPEQSGTRDGKRWPWNTRSQLILGPATFLSCPWILFNCGFY